MLIFNYHFYHTPSLTLSQNYKRRSTPPLSYTHSIVLLCYPPKESGSPLSVAASSLHCCWRLSCVEARPLRFLLCVADRPPLRLFAVVWIAPPLRLFVVVWIGPLWGHLLWSRSAPWGSYCDGSVLLPLGWSRSAPWGSSCDGSALEAPSCGGLALILLMFMPLL